jgi:hypothetical protein
MDRIEMNKHNEQKSILLNAVMALAIGALLGTLSVVPYDRVLGLSGSAGTILQSAISVALLGALNLGRVTGQTFESSRTPERAPGSFFWQSGGSGAPREHRTLLKRLRCGRAAAG